MMKLQTNFLVLDVLKLLAMLVISVCFLAIDSLLPLTGMLCMCALLATTMCLQYKKSKEKAKKLRFGGVRIFVDCYLTISILLISAGLGLGKCQQYPLAERVYLVGSQMTLRFHPEITVASMLLPVKGNEKIASATLLSIYGEHSLQYRHYLTNCEQH